jgi:hypothetical protein
MIQPPAAGTPCARGEFDLISILPEMGRSAKGKVLRARKTAQNRHSRGVRAYRMRWSERTRGARGEWGSGKGRAKAPGRESRGFALRSRQTFRTTQFSRLTTQAPSLKPQVSPHPQLARRMSRSAVFTTPLPSMSSGQPSHGPHAARSASRSAVSTSPSSSMSPGLMGSSRSRA